MLNKDFINRKLQSCVCVLKEGCKLIVPIMILGVIGTMEKKVQNITYVAGEANYGNTVKAIMESDMFSSDKNKLILVIPRDEDSQFYFGVIEIVKSDMFSSNKVNSVKNMVNQPKGGNKNEKTT